jgi:tetratricopeptide (TPR) repeat protein
MIQKDEPTHRRELDKNSVAESTDTEDSAPETGVRVNREMKFRWRVILSVLVILLPTVWYLQKDLHARKEANFQTTCRHAIGDKDWSRLIDTGFAWSEWDADAADAWLYQAQGHQELGDLNRAAQLLSKLPDHNEKTEAALLVAASLYFEEISQPLEAVPILKRILKLNESSITAHQRLIFFYGITLQRVKMLDQIHRAIEVGAEPPDAYVYLHLAGRLTFTNGYLMNQRWLRNEPDSRLFRLAAAIQLSTAKDQAENADDESPADKEARHAEIKDLLREFPDSTSLLRYLLHLAVKRDNPDEVGDLLASSPSHAWNDSVFWRFRGWYHHRFAEFDEAESAYRKSLELYPLDWETWHNLAATFRKKKDLDNAEHAQLIALQGKELRTSILQLPDARSVSPEILTAMRDFCIACGDQTTASSLQTRIDLMTGYQ